jgi:preprotein translocase subunit SecG
MNWIIGFLTVILVLDCLLLILLVLIQLPKKEAGMGTAFGGATTDALFGAGSGNALTKLTKYATGIFFILALGLAILNAKQPNVARKRFEKGVATAASALPVAPPPVNPALLNTNLALTNSPVTATNKPAAAATNADNKTPAPTPPAPPPSAGAPGAASPPPDKAK